MADITQLLTTFSEASGVSGREGAIRDLVAHELAKVTDEVRVDNFGNVVGVRRGTGPKVMIAAHMDEIGLMAKYIDEQGFLRFIPLGGWYDQVLLGQRVVVHGTKGPLYGVVGSKPPHIMDEEERKKPVKIKDMFIDVGARDADDAAALGVEIGSVITIDRKVAPLGNDLVTGKSFDDRAGVVMMVAALELLAGEEVAATIQAVGTVQEEVGLKGARTSAFDLDPDVALISEVTIPGDHPGVTKERRHHRRHRRAPDQGRHPLWGDKRTHPVHPLAHRGALALRPHLGSGALGRGRAVGSDLVQKIGAGGPPSLPPPEARICRGWAR